MTPVADRLEGAAALTAVDVDRAVGLLAAARQGFANLRMAWEVARTQRLLSVALTGAGRRDEAAIEQVAADHALRALRVVTDRVIDGVLARL